MCAINGVTKEDRALVERMNEATKHRGPDGSRVWVGEGVTLGHNRLAIIDLSDRALQPMQSTHQRYSIVFNGEIYNYRELREELREYHFTTESDTEVLLAGYVQWGTEVLKKVRGIFAFGIWDSEKRELILVRDHMGVKPLYYTEQNGTLAFSSELQALAHGGVLDRASTALFLELQYVPSPRTFVQDIHKLPPGYLLRHVEGRTTIEQYFNHAHIETLPPTQTLYETIDAGVERQLVSERPIGVFLSGGFDSSIVLHHVHAHAERVKTFSIAFDESLAESEKYNADALLAEKTAMHYGSDHTTFKLSQSQVANELEHIYQVLDDPVSTSTSVSQYFLNQCVRAQGVVVAFGGDGGDELFGGYTRHRAIMAAHFFQKFPHYLQVLAGYMHPRGKKLQTPLGVPMHIELMATDSRNVQQVFKGEADPLGVVEDFLRDAYTHVPQHMHPLDAYMRVDRQTWLSDHSLTRSDRTSMVHGVEFRVPLLDMDIVRYADTVVPSQKTSPRTGKKIIRETYRTYLPEHLFGQPKRGWLSPGAKWLRDDAINPIVRAILSSEYYNGLDAIFDWSEVERMLDAHCSGEKYAFHPLWSVLILQIWARKNKITA